MELTLDAWGFVLKTGILDIYFQRSGIIAVAVIFIGLRLRKIYLDKKIYGKLKGK
jgi:hypothetical protein